ncbi:hypothetical protein BKA62DRAFT_712749 [Auriculariales sp. MPI-PUGE-AT-0066]|nr:hypothetical protein BKA62DRAFT_712749 [Auriculariales sp. MPI-PUGE-AT-0066]
MLFITLVFLAVTRAARGQRTNASCLPQYDWMFNTLDQSPCQVASWLAGACIDDVFNIDSLQPGKHYIGPATTQLSSPCVCSSVEYALVSACGMCQGESSTQKWSTWIKNCTAGDTMSNGYNHEIPSGTRVPAWAYIDIPMADMLDLNAAQSIASGVIGGLAFLGVIAIAIVWLCLRKRRHRSEKGAQPVYSPAMTKEPGFLSPHTTGTAYTYSPTAPYDPPMLSHPSTASLPPLQSSIVYSQPQQSHSRTFSAASGLASASATTPHPQQSPLFNPHAHTEAPVSPGAFYNFSTAPHFNTSQRNQDNNHSALPLHPGPYTHYPEL